MTEPGTARRRRRRATAGQGPPAPSIPEEAAEAAAPAPATETPAAPPARAPRKPRDRADHDLAGSGASQLGPVGAMRARDLNRPSEADLASAEAELTIVRRHWRPPTI